MAKKLSKKIVPARKKSKVQKVGKKPTTVRDLGDAILADAEALRQGAREGRGERKLFG